MWKKPTFWIASKATLARMLLCNCRKSPEYSFLLFPHLVKSTTYKSRNGSKLLVRGFFDSLYFNPHFCFWSEATISSVEPRIRNCQLFVRLPTSRSRTAPPLPPEMLTWIIIIFKLDANFGRRQRVALTPLMGLMAFLPLVGLRIIVREVLLKMLGIALGVSIAQKKRT